ncbi:MAG: GNAT family N-acetyltransferase [Ruminococcaceae bacterium]|nr:GNAT family N-acetyltransferase [Oscillospiraceae bacterium]
MKIVDFTKEMIPAACQLALDNYAEERAAVPALPENVFLPTFDELAENGLGVAAVDGDTLLGFLCAYGPWEPVYCTRNVRGVFSPLHAHGAVKENRIRIYHRLYQAAGEKWAKAGAASHAVTLCAHDTAANEAFYQYGFGVRCIDLIRPTDSFDYPSAEGCMCSELPASRQSELRALRHGLADHLAQSPCFMADSPEDTARWIAGREEKPPRTFVAEVGGSVAAYIEMIPNGENFATYSPDMLNICGAYCLPQLRGQGIMQTLLNYALSVLRTEGIERLGVDCESFNLTARGFWTKHFAVYTHSVVRRIDENVIAF